VAHTLNMFAFQLRLGIRWTASVSAGFTSVADSRCGDVGIT